MSLQNFVVKTGRSRPHLGVSIKTSRSLRPFGTFKIFSLENFKIFSLENLEIFLTCFARSKRSKKNFFLLLVYVTPTLIACGKWSWPRRHSWAPQTCHWTIEVEECERSWSWVSGTVAVDPQNFLARFARTPQYFLAHFARSNPEPLKFSRSLNRFVSLTLLNINIG